MNKFSTILTHSNCLSKTQLKDYIQQKMGKEETYLVESHLNDCQMCNDTLEALMEEDFAQIDNNLSEIKLQLEKKIAYSPLQGTPTSQTNTTQNKTAPQTKEIGDFEISKKGFYRILAAAGVILFITFGAYSYYHQLTNQPKSNEIIATTNEPLNNRENKPPYRNEELPKIRTEKPMIEEEDVAKIKEEKLPSNPIIKHTESKSVSTEIIAKTEVPNAEKTKANLDVSPAVAAAPSLAKERNIEEGVGTGNVDYNTKTEEYNKQETNKIAEPTIAMNKKTTVAEKRSFGIADEASKMNPKTPEKTSFEKGMETFNNHDYKQSITHFEQALKKSSGSEREDALYHLAISYERTHKIEKAITYYSQLIQSHRYGYEANKKIVNLQNKSETP